jgi:hypothetical protein
MRYGFVTINGIVHAVLPTGTADEFVSVSGILYRTREPQTPDERDAVRAITRQPRKEIRRLSDSDVADLMADKIVARARDQGTVERQDFHQAGIPDDRIDANRDAAFARARRREPKLDAMAVRS